MNARKTASQHTTADNQATGPESTKLFLSAVDPRMVDELRGFVLWLRSCGGRDGMKSSGDVIERAWQHAVKDYRHRFNQDEQFEFAERLPSGRKVETTRREEAVDYERLTISGVRGDVVQEMRGMIWTLTQRSQRDGLNSLGDVVTDMLRHYLPEARKQYNNGHSFGSAQQLPPGRVK